MVFYTSYNTGHRGCGRARAAYHRHSRHGCCGSNVGATARTTQMSSPQSTTADFEYDLQWLVEQRKAITLQYFRYHQVALVVPQRYEMGLRSLTRNSRNTRSRRAVSHVVLLLLHDGSANSGGTRVLLSSGLRSSSDINNEQRAPQWNSRRVTQTRHEHERKMNINGSLYVLGCGNGGRSDGAIAQRDKLIQKLTPRRKIKKRSRLEMKMPGEEKSPDDALAREQRLFGVGYRRYCLHVFTFCFSFVTS